MQRLGPRSNSCIEPGVRPQHWPYYAECSQQPMQSLVGIVPSHRAQACQLDMRIHTYINVRRNSGAQRIPQRTSSAFASSDSALERGARNGPWQL